MKALTLNQVAAVAGGLGGPVPASPPAASPNSLFSGVPTVAELATVGSGLGSGVGASVVIEAAGGTLGAVVEAYGVPVLLGVTTAAGAGLVAAGIVGTWAGVQIYDHLPTSTQDAIGKHVSDAVNGISHGVQNAYHAVIQAGSGGGGGSSGGGGGGHNFLSADDDGSGDSADRYDHALF